MEPILTQSGEKVIIICAPSGAGKTTITKAIMNTFSNLSFSISATTRVIRENEIDGKDYYFLTPEGFQAKVGTGEFVEHENNYGNFYGTLKSEIARLHGENKVIVFDVDVRGAVNLKKYFGENALMIFIKVSMDVLEQRLRARGTESEETLANRLAAAQEEMEYETRADVVIENIDLNTAIEAATVRVQEFLNT